MRLSIPTMIAIVAAFTSCSKKEQSASSDIPHGPIYDRNHPLRVEREDALKLWHDSAFIHKDESKREEVVKKLRERPELIDDMDIILKNMESFSAITMRDRNTMLAILEELKGPMASKYANTSDKEVGTVRQ